MLPRVRLYALKTASSFAWTCEIPAGRSAATLTTTPCLRNAFLLHNSTTGPTRNASTSSSTRWKSRAARDTYTRSARLSGLKSRAAFKLLEINDRHRLFRRGDTVVDLGFAPGSWSQVAVNRTAPGGRVVGIDVIPAQPPRGANALQGNFLSEEIREGVRDFVREEGRGRVRSGLGGEGEGVSEEELELEGRGVVELERQAAVEQKGEEEVEEGEGHLRQKDLDKREGRVVNVVLSDMSEPWPLVTSTWIKSVSNPYRRMLNTSGIAARDHGGSMVRSSTLSSNHPALHVRLTSTL